MTRYSVKKGRRIKKYKKSRKGCIWRGRGRGRRSVRSGKTIKSKIFMKTKRNNVSNRRKMSGGFIFNGNTEKIKEHILSKYSKQLTSNSIVIDSYLTVMSSGDVEISKDAFFAKDFRPEHVVVVMLASRRPRDEFEVPVTYYAIVRCTNIDVNSSCKGIDDSRVLFVKDSGSVESISYKLAKDDTSTNPERKAIIEKIKAVIEKRKDKQYTTDIVVDTYFDTHVWFEVTNSISSTDTYNIFVNNSVSSNTPLLNFFNSIADNIVTREAAHQL